MLVVTSDEFHKTWQELGMLKGQVEDLRELLKIEKELRRTVEDKAELYRERLIELGELDGLD